MKLAVKLAVIAKASAKVIAVCTVITGALTTVLTSHPSLAGFTLVSAGLLTYAASRVFSLRMYEKTKHIAPRVEKKK